MTGKVVATQKIRGSDQGFAEIWWDWGPTLLSFLREDNQSMSDYRRFFVPGGTFFFTVVTYQRRPILTTLLARRCLRQAVGHVRSKWPIEIIAIVLLPDHLHTVWTLPNGDSGYSVRWQKIKEKFTRAYLAFGGLEASGSGSRFRHGERNVWQRRFWEHTCRDEDDVKRCVDYIHWNPVKHGLAQRVCDYP